MLEAPKDRRTNQLTGNHQALFVYVNQGSEREREREREREKVIRQRGPARERRKKEEGRRYRNTILLVELELLMNDLVWFRRTVSLIPRHWRVL